MIRLSMTPNGKLRIDAGPRDVSRLRTVPGIRADTTADPPHWTCAATLYHGVVLRNTFGDEMEYGDDVRAHMRELRRVEAAQRTATYDEGDERLFGYQRRGAGRLSLPGGAMLADEVGTGKTVQALQALRACGAEALPAIVVTTRSMKLRWAAEAAEWAPDVLPVVVTGSATQRRQVLAAAKQIQDILGTCEHQYATRIASTTASGFADLVTRSSSESAIQSTPNVSESTRASGSTTIPSNTLACSSSVAFVESTPSALPTTNASSTPKGASASSVADTSEAGIQALGSMSTTATCVESCEPCCVVRAIATSAGIPTTTGTTYAGVCVIINWEALRNHTRLAHYPGAALSEKDQQLKDLNAIPFRTVIADEAHRMKDPKAKQSRAVWWLGKTATRRWTLTGTPVGNEYVDLWSQFHFIDPEVWTSRSAFLDRYVVSVYNGFTDEPLFLRPETKHELFWWIDNHMLRRTIAELPELASEVPTVREVRLDLELTKQQATVYRKLKKEMMATIDGELLAATDPLVLAGKLAFVASAMPVVSPEGEVISLDRPSNKIDAMLELLEDRELRPAVVFAESRKLIELAAATAREKGYNVGVISGAQNDLQRNAAVTQFQDGELDVLFSTAAGGEGITLTAGASMIFLRTPSSLIMYKQMLGRVPRIGNKRSVIPAYHLVSSKTTDEIAFDVIVSKVAKAEDILRDKDRILGTL